jgi:hypothetical protein
VPEKWEGCHPAVLQRRMMAWGAPPNLARVSAQDRQLLNQVV